MLKGAKTQELLRTSLVRLSTYGILSRWSEDDIRQLFRAMQMAGLTRMSGEADRPLITLSPKGNEVMMGRKKASLVWPFARRGKYPYLWSRPEFGLREIWLPWESLTRICFEVEGAEE